MRWLGAIATVTALLAASPAAQAEKAQDTLRIVWWEQLANVNPYYNELRSGLVVAQQAFDGLVGQMEALLEA